MNGNPMQFLMQLMSSGNNPQQIVQNMMKQNPQFNAMLNQQKQSGMTMEQFARQYAKQNNIDIDSMANMLRNNGARF